jgi:hypothetical protein
MGSCAGVGNAKEVTRYISFEGANGKFGTERYKILPVLAHNFNLEVPKDPCLEVSHHLDNRNQVPPLIPRQGLWHNPIPAFVASVFGVPSCLQQTHLHQTLAFFFGTLRKGPVVNSDLALLHSNLTYCRFLLQRSSTF